MSLILSGSDGVSDIDGTVSTPAIRGTDSNTGIFFPAADTIAFSEGGAEAMRISSGGEVGIGSTATTYKLNIQNASASAFDGMQVAGDNASYNLVFQSGSVSASGTLFGVNKARGQFISSNNSPIVIGTLDAFPLVFGTNLAERMRISSGGNLLVGTTSVPNSGNAIACFGGFYAFALNSSTTNNTWYQGTDGNEFNVYSADGVRRGYLTLAGTWTNTSDIAYKKDIVDIKYSLEDALKLRPVSYLTKDHDIPQIGFIAQEMEQVIPEVVSGEEGSKGISYGSLVALCVKAIQEQQALIENLTTRLNALEGK